MKNLNESIIFTFYLVFCIMTHLYINKYVSYSNMNLGITYETLIKDQCKRTCCPLEKKTVDRCCHLAVHNSHNDDK